jgi:predicted component of type VI protein secretion system
MLDLDDPSDTTIEEMTGFGRFRPSLDALIFSLGGLDDPHDGAGERDPGWPGMLELCRALLDHWDAPDRRALADLAGELLVAIDREVGRQLTVIMTHPRFAALHAAWLGLQTVVDTHDDCFGNSVGVECEVIVADVTAAELRADMVDADFRATWLHNAVYTQRLDLRGGRPIGLMIGGMAFGGVTTASPVHRPEYADAAATCGIDLLRQIAFVAEESLCPFVAAASPGLLGYTSFTTLPEQERLQICTTTRTTSGTLYDEWAALRDHPASRFVGLVAPRVVLEKSLSRRGGFDHWFGWPNRTGDAEDREVARLAFTPLYGSAAYALAAIAVRSVCATGMPSTIAGILTEPVPRGRSMPDDYSGLAPAAGLIPLAGDSFGTDPAGVSVRFPVEIALTGDQERRLGELGLMTVARIAHTNLAAFFTQRMVHRPRYGGGSVANATQELHTILPYLLIATRFAQFAKVHLRREHGRFKTKTELESELNNVLGDRFVGNAKPIGSLQVEVVEDGVTAYNCRLAIAPRLSAEDVQIAEFVTLNVAVSRKREFAGSDESTHN